ncbi:MAG TPA: hypothetical protein VD908_18565, partial [Cytophagales bacterium]|nr:hypothetical protein [Cytophagales bacterium]
MKLIFKNFLKLTFALLIFAGGANGAFTQTTPLEVRVTVAPPYPIRLTDFVSSSSNVFINITNPTTENYKVVITGSLKNEDRDLSISSDPANPGTSCIEVPPGGITLTGMDLAEMFDPSRLSYRNTTMDVIRGNQALPDGNYKLCLRLMDCMVPGRFLSPIPDDFSGCGSFEVNYVDPPVIIQPLCDEVIDGTRGNIPITWTWIPPAGRSGNINFHIRMVEVEPPTRSSYDAMLSSPPVFEVDVQNVTSYNLLIPDDVVLEQGRVYAFQISARDLDEEIVFERDGKGEICKFTYGNALPGSGGFGVSAFYPQDGDVIPFSYFPFIVKYEPYNNSYSRFISDFRLIEGSSEKYSHRRDLNWPRGPLRAQREVTGFGDITESQAQHIAVGKNQTEISTDFSFDKTKTYQWTANVEIEEGSRSHLGNVGTVNFKVGMGPSELKLPVNGDTIPPGSIEFVWKTGPEPARLMPDFAIVQATRATGTTFFNGIVDERWVIEVSKDDRFSEIVHTIAGRLGYNADLNTDPTIIKNELYKDLRENFTITANGKYYWRVKWMNSPDNVSDNSFYVTSPTWFFIISNTATPEIAERDSIPGGCISTCIAEAVTNRTSASGLTAGNTLRIGKFTLTVRTVSSTSVNTFTGEGFVTIPFLNDVKILVDFTSIQYNSDGAIFAGTVKAKADRAFATEEITTGIGGVLSMSETESENLNGFLQDGERLVSLFSGTREIGMPIGIDREIEGNRYVIGVVNIEFSPERAIVDAVMNLNFPTIGDGLMAFGVKDLCITPSGLGDEGRLYLARDWLVVQEGETQFAFKGAEAGDTTRATYVAWDCRGFKCMQVRGEATFPRNMVVPDNVDGTAGTGFVKGTFSAKACRGNNWIASIDFTPFQVAGLDGWGWVASNAYLDFSDLENPVGLIFPRHYADSALLANPRLANTWQGFYMQVVEVRMPPEFANTTSGGRTSFGVNHIIIDKTGFSANIFARNILEVSEGNFEGWGFAIDTVNIAFVSNTFREAGMAGRIGMPIFEPGAHLKYKMALSYEEDDFAYQFRVYTRDTLNIPMWGNAKMFFKPNSDIVIGFNDPVKGDHASANLHGGIHLTGDFGAIPGLNFRGVNFEGLKLSTRADEAGRYFAIDSFYVAHASPQKSAAGFPVNIENIGL